MNPAHAGTEGKGEEDRLRQAGVDGDHRPGRRASADAKDGGIGERVLEAWPATLRAPEQASAAPHQAE